MSAKARYAVSAAVLGALWYLALLAHPDFRPIMLGAQGATATSLAGRHAAAALAVIAATLLAGALLRRRFGAASRGEVWALGALFPILGCVFFVWVSMGLRWLAAAGVASVVEAALALVFVPLGSLWVAAAVGWWLVLPLGWLSALALRRLAREPA